MKKSISQGLPDDKTIEKVAELSRLSFTIEEMAEFSNHFKEIIEFFSDISSLNSDGASVNVHISDHKNVFRPDVVCESIERNELLDGAAAVSDGYVCVPRVVGERDE